MLHCRDDLRVTLSAVQRIACIRRRLRRSLFRLCGRHVNWKHPPDALQLPARGPAAARSPVTHALRAPLQGPSNSAPTGGGALPADDPPRPDKKKKEKNKRVQSTSTGVIQRTLCGEDGF